MLSPAGETAGQPMKEPGRGGGRGAGEPGRPGASAAPSPWSYELRYGDVDRTGVRCQGPRPHPGRARPDPRGLRAHHRRTFDGAAFQGDGRCRPAHRGGRPRGGPYTPPPPPGADAVFGHGDAGPPHRTREPRPRRLAVSGGPARLLTIVGPQGWARPHAHRGSDRARATSDVPRFRGRVTPVRAHRSPGRPGRLATLCRGGGRGGDGARRRRRPGARRVPMDLLVRTSSPYYGEGRGRPTGREGGSRHDGRGRRRRPRRRRARCARRGGRRATHTRPGRPRLSGLVGADRGEAARRRGRPGRERSARADRRGGTRVPHLRLRASTPGRNGATSRCASWSVVTPARRVVPVTTTC